MRIGHGLFLCLLQIHCRFLCGEAWAADGQDRGSANQDHPVSSGNAWTAVPTAKPLQVEIVQPEPSSRLGPGLPFTPGDTHASSGPDATRAEPVSKPPVSRWKASVFIKGQAGHDSNVLRYDDPVLVPGGVSDWKLNTMVAVPLSRGDYGIIPSALAIRFKDKRVLDLDGYSLLAFRRFKVAGGRLRLALLGSHMVLDGHSLARNAAFTPGYERPLGKAWKTGLRANLALRRHFSPEMAGYDGEEYECASYLERKLTEHCDIGLRLDTGLGQTADPLARTRSQGAELYLSARLPCSPTWKGSASYGLRGLEYQRPDPLDPVRREDRLRAWKLGFEKDFGTWTLSSGAVLETDDSSLSRFAYRRTEWHLGFVWRRG